MTSKRTILQRVLDQLGQQLEHLTGASRAMHADASDEQNRAEDRYDTRGLETAYLASSQARQATEIEEALAAFQELKLRRFNTNTPIDLSALVELVSETDHEPAVYLVGPTGGGIVVEEKGTEILVITPESPLGAQLMGRKQGDTVKLETRGPAEAFRITDVW